ncbi:MAG: hypothetical protein K2M63_10840, partial [Muribaculaceae bacterium]|nr:hypothetical protein [Muribaculaceae bacterium]
DEMAKKFFRITVVAIAFMIVVGLCACRTQYVPVETIRTEYREADTTAIYNQLLLLFESRNHKESTSDSLVDRIKETVILNEKGDTAKHIRDRYVYISTNREKELETENKTLRDSLSLLNTRMEAIKTDSIPVIVTVERELSTWEKAKIDFGGIAMGGLVVSVVGIALLAWLARKRRK